MRKLTDAETFGAVIIGFVVIAAVLVLSPLILIWALNTLLSMTIQFTFWNWLAGLAIIVVLRGGK